MAALPVRRGGRNTSVVNPSREFEDIYDRMGQLMNFAFGLTPAAPADMPWVPLADLSETDDAYVVKAELPGVHKDQVNIQLQDRELVISGEVPEPEDGNGNGSRHHSSRRTGRFELREEAGSKLVGLVVSHAAGTKGTDPPRPLEVVALVAQGKSNASIAVSMFLTKRAVEKHINAIFAKLNLVDDSVQSRRVAVTLLYLADRGEIPAAREPALAPWPR